MTTRPIDGVTVVGVLRSGSLSSLPALRSLGTARSFTTSGTVGGIATTPPWLPSSRLRGLTFACGYRATVLAANEFVPQGTDYRANEWGDQVDPEIGVGVREQCRSE